MQEIVWICSYCAEEGRKEDTLELKLFKRYVDDIVCTVKGNPLDYLEYANSLHKNLQFTLETPNGSAELAFLDLNINLNEDRKISCHWYQISTDTGIILNFRSCAPLHTKTVIQGTVHRIFNATSDWQSFDAALKKNQEILTENQYLSLNNREHKHRFFVQNRGNITQNFASTLRTTWKLRTCWPTLKSPFDKNLKSMWYIMLHVMDAVPSTLAKSADT